MTVDEVYRLMLFAVAKNTQQGYLSPDDFNLTINVAQRSYLDYLLGEYQKYQIQRPIAVVEFGQNERIRESLAPLIYGTVLPVNSSTGIGSFPYDFEYTDAMWSQYGFYNIKFVQQDRLHSYYRSTIDPIAQNPVYLIKHEGFQFYPETIGNARLSYVRKPPSIVYAYVYDGNGIPVFNPFNSVNPVWSDTDMLQIVVRALMLVGVNLQFSTVIQYSQDIKQSGQ